MKKLIIWIPALVLLVAFIVYESVKPESGVKTAYIDVKKIYAEFNLSKELDAKLKDLQNARTSVLDSLSLVLESYNKRFASTKVNEEDKLNLELAQREFSIKRQRFVEDNETLSNQYQEQILTQLNQYLEDYRKVKRYDYIFGAAGNGSMMAANKAKDITDEVLAYINHRYSGGK